MQAVVTNLRVQEMTADDLKAVLAEFKNRVEEKLDHQDELLEQKFSTINTRFDSQNMALVRVGEIVQKAGEASQDAISRSQEAMSQNTRTLMEANKDSLTRVHQRLDEIKSELADGSKKFVELSGRISNLERLVYGGGSLLAAGLASLFFKSFGG
jgi:chromosome segregation ATPase